MVGREIVAVEGIGNVIGIKALAGIADDDGDAAIGLAGEGAKNSLGGVAIRAVKNRIGESFAERSFDGEAIVFTKACGAQPAESFIGDGGDFFHFGRDAKTKVTGFEIGRCFVRGIGASGDQVRVASSATFMLRCS